jgi:hypothetical protein
MPRPRRLISTVWANLRGWLRGAGASDPGLQEAEVARRFAQRMRPHRRTPAGGLDEPGLVPIQRGERMRVLFDRDRRCYAEALEAIEPEAALRTTKRILANSQELHN